MHQFITLLFFLCSFSVNCSIADGADATSFRKKINQMMGACDVSAGMADSYVLAMSLQPGFCQTSGSGAGKPECIKLTPDSYEAKHLVLHGLWPNQNACGQHYAFCGVEQKTKHCAYSPVRLSEQVDKDLKKLMPSYHYGSCLERHEWNKHGSCQILSSDDYFSLAMRLTAEADQSDFGVFLTVNNGNLVKRSVMREAIAKSFGTYNSGKFYLGCKNGLLVDVFISLPVWISFDKPLSSLVNSAPDYQYKDTCPTNILISSYRGRGALH